MGKKQHGMLDIEGFENPLEIRKKAEMGARRTWPVGTQEQERPIYEKVQAALDKHRAAEEQASRSTLGDKITQVKRLVIGHDIDLRNALDKAGPLGVEARLLRVLQDRATDAAKVEMQRISKTIFNISSKEKKLIDDLTMIRRDIQIASYRP